MLALHAPAMPGGLDFDCSHGLSKVWTFSGQPLPSRTIARVGTLPASCRERAGAFEEFGLDHVFYFASDVQKRSMNVYFYWDAACRTIDWIQRFARWTGGPVPDAATCRDILAAQAVTSGIGLTVRHDRPDIERWSIYAFEVPLPRTARRPCVLPALAPRIESFLELAPSLNESPQFNLAWSFGPAGAYIKAEKSYARDMTFFLTTEWGGDFRHAGAA